MKFKLKLFQCTLMNSQFRSFYSISNHWSEKIVVLILTRLGLGNFFVSVMMIRLMGGRQRQLRNKLG